MLRKRCLSIPSLLIMVLYFTSFALAGDKIEICHTPPDQPEVRHTITVNENAVTAHLSHGDTVGACDSGCANPTDCDDGSLCTSDTCENGTCIHTSVDCSDGYACTDDYCDAGDGCISVYPWLNPWGAPEDITNCGLCPSDIAQFLSELNIILKSPGVLPINDAFVSWKEGPTYGLEFKVYLKSLNPCDAAAFDFIRDDYLTYVYATTECMNQNACNESCIDHAQAMSPSLWTRPQLRECYQNVVELFSLYEFLGLLSPTIVDMQLQ